MRVLFLAAAKAELRETFQFYQNRVEGLGYEFLTEVRAVLERIKSNPSAWLHIKEGIRRCRTHRFPYGVVYSIESNTIIIISIMHLHRHPEAWQKNLPG